MSAETRVDGGGGGGCTEYTVCGLDVRILYNARLPDCISIPDKSKSFIIGVFRLM